MCGVRACTVLLRRVGVPEWAVANTETAGRKWSSDMVKQIGRTVKAARRGRTAQQISDRCGELGYPLTRTVIAKLESGHRGDTLTVPELLVIAAALEIPPALLLFPEFPDGRKAPGLPDQPPPDPQPRQVKLLPDRESTGYEAVKWLVGERTLPARQIEREKGKDRAPTNDGTALVAAVLLRDRLESEHVEVLAKAAGDPQTWRPVAIDLEDKMAEASARITYFRDRLGLAKAVESQGGE